MILIRGIKGEFYARKIKKGIVDCRDVLSTVLQPPVTGYEYSDYYERNFVKAVAYMFDRTIKDIHDPRLLYSVLIDYYIPHIYMTYFHILNENSLEWLEKFEDDYSFIAIDVQIDKLTQTAIGNEFFGARMSYVDSIRQVEQDGYKGFYSACMCSIEKLFADKLEMMIPLRIYNTLAFALLCRERDEKFTDIENEFRIIAYTCPRFKGGIRSQETRNVRIKCKSGVEYTGVLTAGMNPTLSSSLYAVNSPDRFLDEVLAEERGMITIDSQFKSINIKDISNTHKYLGGKAECAKYIKKMLKCKVQDTYVNKTICKKYDLTDIQDAVYVPGHQKIEY